MESYTSWLFQTVKHMLFPAKETAAGHTCWHLHMALVLTRRLHWVPAQPITDWGQFHMWCCWVAAVVTPPHTEPEISLTSSLEQNTHTLVSKGLMALHCFQLQGLIFMGLDRWKEARTARAALVLLGGLFTEPLQWNGSLINMASSQAPPALSFPWGIL